MSTIVSGGGVIKESTWYTLKKGKETLKRNINEIFLNKLNDEFNERRR